MEEILKGVEKHEEQYMSTDIKTSTRARTRTRMSYDHDEDDDDDDVRWILGLGVECSMLNL